MAQKFKDAFQKMAQNLPKGGGAGGGGGGGRGAGAAKAAGRAASALMVAGGMGYGAYNSVFTVDGGHRAVVFNRVVGMKETVYNEGLNFNIPWFERPVIYDIRTRPVNLQTLTGSKDLQMFTIGVRVLHRPDPNQLVWIYRHLGLNYDERILPSLMNECAKAVVARYNANELLTKRDEVSASITQELRARAKGFNVMLEDVALTHLAFSPEYAKAVEAKQVAQQDAARAKYVVLGAQQEKKTIITRARGEAESTGMLAVQERLDAMDWPEGMKPEISLNGQPSETDTPVILWDGEWEVTWVTFRDMGAAFGVALLGIYILVVAQFGSFRLPLVILTPVPLTFLGIMGGHWLFGAPFSATSMIGFIALAGIIVRNSILLVDFIRNANDDGEVTVDILIEAGATRFKPILLTALAAMIGAAVILVDPIFQGLAISLLFGLLSSTALTVLVIPAIYRIFKT